MSMNSKYEECSALNDECKGPVVIYLKYRFQNFNNNRREIEKYYCKFHHDVAAKNINESGGYFRLLEHRPL